MLLTLLSLVAVPVPTASPDPADLVPTPEVQVKCRALVRQLGSDDFEVREEAQKQLATLGRLARPALLDGAGKSDDQEVRSRCFQLLPRATQLERRARLKTFLADTEERYDHNLPGWAAFRKIACSEWSFFGRTLVADRTLRKATREVFAELMASKANRALLRASQESKFALGELIVARKLELSRPRSSTEDDNPTVADAAALTFAEAMAGTQHVPRRAAAVPSIIETSGLDAVVRADNDRGRVYRAMVVAWVNAQVTAREMADAMRLASRLDMTELSADLAARILVLPGTVTGVVRSNAIRTLVSHGTERQIPILERLGDRLTTVHTIIKDRAKYPVRLRDVTLGLSIALSEQKLTDYGYSDLEATPTGSPPQAYSYSRYYFEDDAARTKAQAKWAEWRKTNDR